MLIDSPQIVEGSAIQNATVPSGPAFPGSPSVGELFRLTSGAVGFYTYSGTAWELVARDSDLQLKANTASPIFTGPVTAAGGFVGNASSATKLQTARNISGVAFDGTANITLSTTGITEGTNLYYTNARASAAAPVQTVFGRTGAIVLTSADVTGALGFTPANKAGDTFTGNVTAPTFIGALTGNAATATLAASATKLATARTINGVPFDGTANITVSDPVTSTKIQDTLNGVLRLERTSYPQLQIKDTDAGANLGQWGMWVNEGGDSLILGPQTDANSGTMNLQLIRTGGAKIYGNIFDIDNGVNTAATRISMTGPAGYDRSLVFYTAGKNRWSLTTTSEAETGGNAGSNFRLNRYDDAGAFIDIPLSVSRSNGSVNIANDLTVMGGQVYISQPAGADRGTILRSAGANRWYYGANNVAETGNNVGSDFFINRYADNSDGIDTALAISRANGNVTITNDVVVNGGQLYISQAAGQDRAIMLRTGSIMRWTIGASSTAESGSNVGSDYFINRHNDAGAYIDTPLTINRSTGVTSINNLYAGYIQTNTGIVVGNGLSVTAGGIKSVNGDISGPILTIVGDRLENYSQDIDTGAVGISYRGYQGGTTRFRDFIVFDGKGGGILNITGSSKYARFAGSVEGVTGFISSTPNGLRLKMATDASGYGTILRNDGTNFYVLSTALNDANGVFTANRPLAINNATGNVTMNHNLQVLGAITGSAGVLRLESASYPQVILKDTDAGTNLGQWGMWINEGGDSLGIGPQTDTNTGTMRIQASRGGTVKTYGQVFEVDATGYGTGGSRLTINGLPSSNRALSWYTSSKSRWAISVNAEAETGTNNAGSAFAIERFNDAGTYIDAPIYISRSDGNISFNTPAYFNKANIYISGAAGVSRSIVFQSTSSYRWTHGTTGDAETGSNAGSDYFFNRHGDNGVFIETALRISRANGNITIPRTLSAGTLTGGTVSSSGYLTGTGVSITSNAPVVHWFESDQAGAAGTWRMVGDGAALRIDMNTAATNDFATYKTVFNLSPEGLMTAKPIENVRTVTASTTTTSVDMNTGDNATIIDLTLASNTALTFANLPNATGKGFVWTLITRNDGTANRALSFGNTNIDWAGGQVPNRTTAANAVDIYTFVLIGTVIYGSISILDAR